MSSDQGFICGSTGKVYKTKQGLIRAESREKLAAERKDYFRLNAESPQHLFDLISYKSKEFWGWDFELIGLKVHNVDKRDYWSSMKNPIRLGVHVEISFMFNPNRRHNRRQHVWQYIGKYISGVTEGPNMWHNITRDNSYVDHKLWLPLDKFPIINKNYEEFLRQEKILHDWIDEKRNILREANDFSDLMDDTMKQKDIIRIMTLELEKSRDLLNKIIDVHKYNYLNLWLPNNPEPSIDPLLRNYFTSER